MRKLLTVRGACEHNLKNIDIDFQRQSINVVTGVSGSGKSSLAFDTVLAEAQRRFFYTLSHYSRQFLDLGSRPDVKEVLGLSPAIALSQNETQPSKKATVGTLSDCGELLAVLLARFAQKQCPYHGVPTESQTLADITSTLSRTFSGKLVALCVPVATGKKGHFSKQMTAFAEKGYGKVWIDGEMMSLSPVPRLNREKKHHIKLVIDIVKVDPKKPERLLASLETVFREGNGQGEYWSYDKAQGLNPGDGGSLSLTDGCPECGYSWPKLDSRYLSINSLGRCGSCRGYGVLADEVDEDEFPEKCSDCCGTGLDQKFSALKLGTYTPQQLHQLSIQELFRYFQNPGLDHLESNPAWVRVRKELIDQLRRICEVGLGYLQLSRRVHTLSGGELQRLRLSGILAESLRGVLYVLDEPSQGLHPTELETIWKTLVKLKEAGNTIIIVDHDEFFIRRADYVVDMGPGGGAQGGEIVIASAPKKAQKSKSLTFSKLTLNPETDSLSSAGEGSVKMSIRGANLHNLGIESVDFAKGCLNVVTGVSGAGKSSLVLHTLYPNLKRGELSSNCKKMTGWSGIERVERVTRKPLAKNSTSMPATWLDIFTEVRKLYERLPESQVLGLQAKDFSINVDGGRCPECKGRGEVTLSMRFLADARVRCASCSGRRYKDRTLGVKYLGHSIDQILELTIDQAVALFQAHKKILRRLKPAQDLGLGYLKLGQPSSSLSGGEAQRLKLVPYLTKALDSGSLLIMDEPTQGLHTADVEKLLACLRRFSDQGVTIILIEHNVNILCAADWLIELGPGSAREGGQLVYQGGAAGLVADGSSPTGSYLRALMEPSAASQ